jgi:SEN1 N terminal
MDVLEALLQRKLANPLDDVLNGEFLSESITYITIQGANYCMWCKLPLITAELFWLFSLDDSEHLEWFKRVTTRCLQRCRPCIEAYYRQKARIIDRFRSVYDPKALNTFIESINRFDVHRLSLPLSVLEQDSSKYRSPEVMFSLFEILACPRWIKSPELGVLFERVLVRLIHAKRMLRVTENLPGVVLCAFHLNDTLRKWASTTLLETVKTEGTIIDEEYSWNDILTCYCALSELGSVSKVILIIVMIIIECTVAVTSLGSLVDTSAISHVE